MREQCMFRKRTVRSPVDAGGESAQLGQIQRRMDVGGDRDRVWQAPLLGKVRASVSAFPNVIVMYLEQWSDACLGCRVIKYKSDRARDAGGGWMADASGLGCAHCG
jgi:hypothetical protein